MDAVLFGGAPIRDKGTMVDRVMQYVSRFYDGEANETLLRTWSTAAVDTVWGEGPRVTKYVPMLALREVRARVVESLEARLEAGELLPEEATRDLWSWQTRHLHEEPASHSVA